MAICPSCIFERGITVLPCVAFLRITSEAISSFKNESSFSYIFTSINPSECSTPSIIMVPWAKRCAELNSNIIKKIMRTKNLSFFYLGYIS